MTNDNTVYGFGREQARDINKATGIVLGTVSGGTAGQRDDATAARGVVVELLTDLPEDDYKPHAARQVTWNGSEWAFVQPVDVRKITAAAIAAGSGDEPTRLFAEIVGNLGLVVLQPGTGSSTDTTSSGTPASTCCGCYESDDWPAYDWGDGLEPVTYQLAGPSLSCCGTGAGVLTRDPDADEWTSDAVDCGDESTLSWSLTPGGVLTAEHSVEGMVARYTRNAFDADRWCAQRFDIDEGATPIHDRACTICGEEVCLTPARRYLVSNCFGGSQHSDVLPLRWRFTEQDIDTGQGFFDDTGVLEYYGTYPCEWRFADCQAGEYQLKFCPDTKLWRIWYSATVGFGCGNVGNLPYRAPCTETYAPVAEWADADFTPFGANVQIVNYAGGGTYQFTLEAF